MDFKNWITDVLANERVTFSKNDLIKSYHDNVTEKLIIYNFKSLKKAIEKTCFLNCVDFTETTINPKVSLFTFLKF